MIIQSLIFIQVMFILVQLSNLIVFLIFAEQQFCKKGMKGLSPIDAWNKYRPVNFSDLSK